MVRENPFFILNIPLSADKHTIYASADDLSLLLDPAVCDEAAAELSSPLRRLEAELDWFPEDEEAVIDLIREDVSAGRSVSPATIEKLSPSGRLNAALYNLAVPVSGQGRVSTVNLETGVREIDSLIDNCSLADITEGINLRRRTAGITETDALAINIAWDRKLQRIHAEIAGLLDQLGSEDYVNVISELSDGLEYAGKAYRHESVIFGLTDRYEIRMQPEIERLTEKLTGASDAAEKYALTSLDFPLHYRSFMRKFKRWTDCVKPVQKVAAARGAEYQLSKETWRRIHGFSQLAIRKASLEAAYKLALLFRESFGCIPSLKEALDQDVRTAEEAIRFITKKTPEQFLKIEARNRLSSKVTTVMLLLAFLFMGIMYFILPTEAEQAQDPDSDVYKEMWMPEKRDYHGDYEAVRMPATGFVFQDTLGDESARTCSVTIRNNTGYSYFIRFSDRDYGDTTLAGFETEGYDPAEELLKDIREGQTDPKKYYGNFDGKVLSFVVRTMEETEVTLPPGEYLISYDSGPTWYGWKFRFNRQFRTITGLPEYDWPVMTFDTDDPYSFEGGHIYSIETGSGTVDGSIVLDEH
ncbi:MAG: hypothetical protein IJJ31_00320 [Mogibacterium sp.]|nr:hypothetical protein [Mogibacterium sp.]